MREPTEFDAIYADALRTILRQPDILNKRTGKRVRALHGMLFQTSPRVIPLVTLRDIKPLWSCAEAVWFMGGRSDTAFMSKFGFKVWEKFADEKGHVDSATGYRWRTNFAVDQLKELIKKLTVDLSNRQAVLTSWDPTKDNLTPGKNVPCVDMWHFHIIAEQLHMSVLQRSGDMYFGVPHDVFGSRLIQELLAAGLGVVPGAISYLVSNAHLYEDQWEPAAEMVNRAQRMIRRGEGPKNMPPHLKLAKDDFVRAMIGDDTLPLDLHKKIAKIYDPWPAISGPKLVL